MSERELPRLLAVLGSPIAHSASPAMHQAGLAALGFPAHYLPFEVDVAHLPAALEGLSALSALGVNLTAPLKEAAIPHLVRVDPVAAQLGAANTLVPTGRRRPAGFVGHNTDLPALGQSLLERVGSKVPPRATVFGAGGTAATSLMAMAELGVKECTLLARTPKRGLDLLERLAESGGLGKLEVEVHPIAEAVDPAPIVVNATPLGREGARPAIARRHLGAATLVVDWVYRPGGTALARIAAERGVPVIDGSELLLGQGVRALALFTGGEPGPKVVRAMRGALHRHLRATSSSRG